MYDKKAIQNRKGEDMAADNTGYCVKCKTKREMVKTERVRMKNGRPAMKGKCSVCGTGMYKILSNSE